MRLRLPIALKLFLTFSGLALAVSGTVGIVLYLDASKSFREEIRSHLMAIAATTAGNIDPSLHQQIISRNDEKSSAYSSVQTVLRQSRKANPAVRYIYTLRPDSNKAAWTFVVDAEEDAKLVSHTGDRLDAGRFPELIKAVRGPSADYIIQRDKWGEFLSGYAPIMDERGHVEAIVGVDMSAAILRGKEAKLQRALLQSSLLTVFLAALLSLVVTSCVTKSIRVFTNAAQRVHNGELDFQVQYRSKDEIGDLAHIFTEMIAGLKESRDRLLEGNSRDFLTGLYNHMYFHNRLETEVQRSKRHNRELCVVMLDLDRFKSVNDTLGHPIGDSILHQVASVFEDSLRKIDIPVRYGGDEFVAILPDTNLEAGMEVTERIRVNVEAHSFIAVPLADLVSPQLNCDEHNTIRMTVTAGVSCYPHGENTRDGLVMAADIALCRAKHVCRNSVMAYDPLKAEAAIDPGELYRVLRDSNGAAVASLASAVRIRQQMTCGHPERVATYALDIAAALPVGQETLDLLKIAGLLHDVGRIGVADSVISKVGSLTKEERSSIQQHPNIGASILKRTPQLDGVIPAVIYHHERWDGAGYPDGLVGEQIPLVARILAIADAFDAMTSDRPYRNAMSVEAAILELKAEAGKQFDPHLIECFITSVISGKSGLAA